MADIKIIGDSILKGTLYNSETNSFDFHNYLQSIPSSENLSKFGCTVTKGSDYINRVLEKDSNCKYILMDFGGNDSDYNWKEISDDPLGKHSPKTPIEVFTSTYVSLIRHIKELGITPVITTLCPICSRKYYAYLLKAYDCSSARVMTWLKDISRLGETQERYSEIVKQIAEQEQVSLIDLRKPFLEVPDFCTLLCADGIHPNEEGQKIILDCLSNFFKA